MSDARAKPGQSPLHRAMGPIVRYGRAHEFKEWYVYTGVSSALKTGSTGTALLAAYNSTLYCTVRRMPNA